MNPAWQEFLGAAGAHIENGSVADFGDLPAELLAARDATIVAPLLHLGLFECAGDDTRSFLHNQLTSDINHLAADIAQHSAWCSAKGRMQASFLLYRQATGVHALVAADLLESTVKRLQMFVLRSKVKIADLSATHEILGVSGALAEQALQAAGLPLPAKAMEITMFKAGVVIRLADARFVVVVAAQAAPALWTLLSSVARPASPLVWQWLDIQAGITLISGATKEAFVPQMANFDKIGGVSFHKGCYPGQEVVARTQYLGKVKRHLYRIHAAGAFAAGAPLFASSSPPEQPCGLVANAAPAPGGGYDALAVIQESFVGGDSARLRIEVPGRPELQVENLAALA